MSKNVLIGWSNKKAQYQCQSNLCDQYNRVTFLHIKSIPFKRIQTKFKWQKVYSTCEYTL